MFIYTYRVVSLDFEANMSSEVEILCHKANCGLVKPISMAVVKDQMYILRDKRRISLFESKWNNTFYTLQKKKNRNCVISTHLTLDTYKVFTHSST